MARVPKAFSSLLIEPLEPRQLLSITPAHQSDLFLANNQPTIPAYGGVHKPGFKLAFDFVSLPRTVSPGQTVDVEVQYNLNTIDPNAVLFLNAFGDWNPSTELTSLIDGEIVPTVRSDNKNFSFTAPSAAGEYRIRFPYVEAFQPVSNFFGTTPHDFDPGFGPYAEVTFDVKTPPQTDFFATAGQPDIAPFGLDAESTTGIAFQYLDLPPVVSPGQSVTLEANFSTTTSNNCPSCVIFMNVLGDWQPDTSLGNLINFGFADGFAAPTTASVTFTAPTTPGEYRVRVPYVEDFSPVPNFYGTSTSSGPYAELKFRVKAPPQTDFFATVGQPTIAPFGLDAESTTGIAFDYIDLPTSVGPGQSITLEASFSATTANLCPGCVVFMNVLGDWQPATPLGSLINSGSAINFASPTTASVTFTAPTTPGEYRVRVPYVEDFFPVPNFYGATTSSGPYAEMKFQVLSTPTLQPETRVFLVAGTTVTERQDNVGLLKITKARLRKKGPIRAFRVTNDGQATLNLAKVKVPKGYKLVRGLPATLAPGQSATFKIQLLTTRRGTFAGSILIRGNDIDEATFDVRVSGKVT